jgi:transcription elongation factor Elf1
MEKFDTDYTRDPICPHCGHKQLNAWELFTDMEEDVEMDCGECDKPFICSRQVEVSYSTDKIDEDYSDNR